MNSPKLHIPNILLRELFFKSGGRKMSEIP